MLVTWYTLATVLSADLLATSGDIAATWSSPILPKLKSNSTTPFDHTIDDDEESWISSLLNVGAMVGAFLFGYICSRFGRKIALLSNAIPHVISYLTLAFAQHVYWYYFARLLGGIGLGGGCTLLPMYVAEVAEDSNRGLLTSTVAIFFTFGNVFPYVLGPYLSIMWFNVLLALVPITFLITFTLIAPESPYYLAVRDRLPEAEKVLMKLRSNDRVKVQEELKRIQLEMEMNQSSTTVWDFVKSKIYMKALGISVVIIIAYQFSGINAILFYTQEIFEAAGVNGLAPEVSSIIIGIVIFVSSFGTPFILDRWGRKIIMIISLLGITVSHVAFGSYFYLQDHSIDVSSVSWLPLVSMIFYIIMFDLGIGPISWTISSELFPTNVQSYASATVAFACWCSSFVVTKFFNNMLHGMGVGGTFWFYGGCCFVTAIFTIVVIPETKGKSFQEIQELLGHKTD